MEKEKIQNLGFFCETAIRKGTPGCVKKRNTVSEGDRKQLF